jgi:hypothetical protein
VGALLQRDSYDNEKHERVVQTKEAPLELLLTAVTSGLSRNPALQVGTLPAIPLALACPPSGSVPREANPESCVLPARLEPAAFDERIRSSGFSHFILLFAEVVKDNLGRKTTWGLGPGIPMFTSETTVVCSFKVTARVYDLATGEVVTEAIAADGDSGAYGVMMIVYPFYLAPNERQYLEAIGRAVGEEVSRRFRFEVPTSLEKK